MTFNLKRLFSQTPKLLVIVTFMAFMLVGCDDDDEVSVDPVEVAYVSLYQASPNAPALDIIVDNRRINTYQFNYTDKTGYLRFRTGERNLQFGPSGANNIVADTTVNLENEKAYSVFLVDEYANLDILVLEDNEEPPAAGNALVRFVNLSPDAPSLDLAVEGETQPTFNDQSFKESSGFMEISADQYDFEVKANEDVLLNLPNINLQSGWYYTIVVRGYSTPPSGNNNVLSAEVLVN